MILKRQVLRVAPDQVPVTPVVSGRASVTCTGAAGRKLRISSSAVVALTGMPASKVPMNIITPCTLADCCRLQGKGCAPGVKNVRKPARTLVLE